MTTAVHRSRPIVPFLKDVAGRSVSCCSSAAGILLHEQSMSWTVQHMLWSHDLPWSDQEWVNGWMSFCIRVFDCMKNSKSKTLCPAVFTSCKLNASGFFGRLVWPKLFKDAAVRAGTLWCLSLNYMLLNDRCVYCKIICFKELTAETPAAFSINSRSLWMKRKKITF